MSNLFGVLVVLIGFFHPFAELRFLVFIKNVSDSIQPDSRWPASSSRSLVTSFTLLGV